MTENNSAIVAEEAPAATLAPALDANQSAGLKRDLENDITSTSSKSGPKRIRLPFKDMTNTSVPESARSSVKPSKRGSAQGPSGRRSTVPRLVPRFPPESESTQPTAVMRCSITSTGSTSTQFSEGTQTTCTEKSSADENSEKDPLLELAKSCGIRDFSRSGPMTFTRNIEMQFYGTAVKLTSGEKFSNDTSSLTTRSLLIKKNQQILVSQHIIRNLLDLVAQNSGVDTALLENRQVKQDAMKAVKQAVRDTQGMVKLMREIKALKAENQTLRDGKGVPVVDKDAIAKVEAEWHAKQQQFEEELQTMYASKELLWKDRMSELTRDVESLQKEKLELQEQFKQSKVEWKQDHEELEQQLQRMCEGHVQELERLVQSHESELAKTKSATQQQVEFEMREKLKSHDELWRKSEAMYLEKISTLENTIRDLEALVASWSERYEALSKTYQQETNVYQERLQAAKDSDRLWKLRLERMNLKRLALLEELLTLRGSIRVMARVRPVLPSEVSPSAAVSNAKSGLARAKITSATNPSTVPAATATATAATVVREPTTPSFVSATTSNTYSTHTSGSLLTSPTPLPPTSTSKSTAVGANIYSPMKHHLRSAMAESEVPGVPVFTFPGETVDDTTDIEVCELAKHSPLVADKTGNDKVAKSHKFSLQKVFDPMSTQQDVYKEIEGLVHSAIGGHKVCILAYGQTGSGKTYTMFGDVPQESALIGDSSGAGVIPRALFDIFQEKEKVESDGWTVDVSLSMLEIYNDSIRDLLPGQPSSSATSNESNSALELRTQTDGSVYVEGLTVHACPSAQIGLNLVHASAAKRSTHATCMNQTSSRSHAVCVVEVHTKSTVTGLERRGHLFLVDLAGSERVGKSNVAGDRLKEAQHINKSLSTLGDVLFALQTKAKHIPYRNSKLTYLLKDALGEQDAKTLLLCALNPLHSNVMESLSTLRLAERAACVHRS